MGFIAIVAVAVAVTLVVAAIVDAATNGGGGGQSGDATAGCYSSLEACESKNGSLARSLENITETNRSLAEAVAACETGG